MRIGIDLDEVLYPWYERAHEASVAAGITNGVTPTSWAPYLDYGCAADDWFKALSAATESGKLYSADPIKDSVRALRVMAAGGHSLHIVTARGALVHGAKIRALTVAWLERFSVPFDSLTFSTDKTIVNTDWFIDDHPGNVAALEAAGVRAFLLSTPANKHWEWPRRVDHVQEFADLVVDETARALRTAVTHRNTQNAACAGRPVEEV